MRSRLLALFIVTITITLTFLNVGVSPVGAVVPGNVAWAVSENNLSNHDDYLD